MLILLHRLAVNTLEDSIKSLVDFIENDRTFETKTNEKAEYNKILNRVVVEFNREAGIKLYFPSDCVMFGTESSIGELNDALSRLNSMVTKFMVTD